MVVYHPPDSIERYHDRCNIPSHIELCSNEEAESVVFLNASFMKERWQVRYGVVTAKSLGYMPSPDRAERSSRFSTSRFASLQSTHPAQALMDRAKMRQP